MPTYSRFGKPSQPNQTESQNKEEPKGIQIDGFKQVLDMLKSAEPAFRESLLKRLAVRDRDLVRSLRKDLEFD